MGAADVLFSKAMEYKQKYLNNLDNNKKLFTESYKEKALNYLHEAAKLNHANAYYQLAIIHSTGWKGNKVYIENFQYSDAPKYLKKADELGHQDASYDYALYLLRFGLDHLEKYNQVMKVYQFGRENDYIPLVKYYMRGNKKHLPISSEDKIKVFEILKKHKPENSFLFITWEYALEYIEGLYYYGSREEAFENAKLLFSNREYVDADLHCYLAEFLLKLYRENNDENGVRNLIDLMTQSHQGEGIKGTIVTRLHDDIMHMYEFALSGKIYSYEDVFNITKERLLGKNKELPTTEEQLYAYARHSTNQNGILIYQLGKMMMEGTGVLKNEQLGFIYLKVAHELKESKNRYYDLLGDCYYSGKVTKKDYQKALDIYKESYPSLREVQMAFCYFRLEKYNEAFKMYLKLYNEKEPTKRGQWLLEGLGYMYFNGKGTAKDVAQAKQCFEEALVFDSAYSYNMLGLCCMELEPARCFRLFKAAYRIQEGSHIEYNIGRCYEFGLGVDFDLYKAKEWYELSIAHNYSYASQRLNEVNIKIKDFDARVKKVEEEEKRQLEMKKKAETLKKEIFSANSSSSSYSNSRKKLESLIGLASVKEEVDELEAQMIDYKRRMDMGLPASNISKHMVFTGNAGTGKTTVARIVAEILKENGIVSKGHLVETDRSGLVGQFIGHTGPKTKKVVESAIGGVLFIDEAYSLVPKDNDRDFGQEAITTLLKMMEDHKDDLVVIVAGYKKEMKDFIDANPGLKSRFTTYIDFPDYTKDELTEIFKLRAQGEENKINKDCFEKLNHLWDQLLKIENFGNGRAVRNVYEDVIKRRSKRLRTIKNPTREDMLTITKEDIPESIDIE